MDFKALIDPSTTLGAFLISLLAGILGGLFVGFITGSNYQKRKVNTIKADQIDGDVFQGSSNENLEEKKNSKTKNRIIAETIGGSIVQDSAGVILNGEQKPNQGKKL